MQTAGFSGSSTAVCIQTAGVGGVVADSGGLEGTIRHLTGLQRILDGGWQQVVGFERGQVEHPAAAAGLAGGSISASAVSAGAGSGGGGAGRAVAAAGC